MLVNALLLHGSYLLTERVYKKVIWYWNCLKLICIKLMADCWAWELVTGGWWGRTKIPGTAGRFHDKPVSGNQPCKRPPTHTVTLKELQWRNLPDQILTMNHFLWGMERARHWTGKLVDQRSDPQRSAEQANCKFGDQSSDLSKVVINED